MIYSYLSWGSLYRLRLDSGFFLSGISSLSHPLYGTHPTKSKSKMGVRYKKGMLYPLPSSLVRPWIWGSHPFGGERLGPWPQTSRTSLRGNEKKTYTSERTTETYVCVRVLYVPSHPFDFGVEGSLWSSPSGTLGYLQSLSSGLGVDVLVQDCSDWYR